MKDESKTKAQLIAELRDLRHQIGEAKTLQLEHVSARGALLESAAAAIVIINEEGCIVLVNKGAEDMFGYSRQEMTGQPLEILQTQDTAIKVVRLLPPVGRAPASPLTLHARRRASRFYPPCCRWAPRRLPFG